jgi:hypothetical protein
MLAWLYVQIPVPRAARPHRLDGTSWAFKDYV